MKTETPLPLHGIDAIDLTWPIGENLPVAQEYPPIILETPFSVAHGDIATAEVIHMGLHIGTHVDTPSHFFAGRETLDDLAPFAFSGPAIMVDVADRRDGWQEISAHDITAWEEATSEQIGVGDIVVFRTGYGLRWAELPPGPREADTGWPYLGTTALDLLLERDVRAVGVETPDPDRRSPTTNEAHYRLLGAGVFIIETLAHLEQVPWRRFFLLAIALPFAGATGSPVRAIAVPAPRPGTGAPPPH